MMRIIGSWRASLVLACVLATIAAPEAGAQSLFQSLFGNLFTSAPPKPAPSPAPSVKFSPLRQGSNFPARDFDYRSYEPGQQHSAGNYRTVCVRPCDGYYFPISGASTRWKFNKDAEACSARCGGGRLYYLPRHSEDIAAMVDLGGRRYDQLQNAFVYRKRLINGCACRPMPWSAAERARHNRYAYAEEILRLNEKRAAKLRDEALAASQAQTIAVDAENPPDTDSVALVLDQGEADQAVAEAARSTPAAHHVHTTDDAYLAVVKAAISQAEVTAGQSQGLNNSNNASQIQHRKSTVPRRPRRTKRKSSPAQGWPLAGGGKYTWPGDR